MRSNLILARAMISLPTLGLAALIAAAPAPAVAQGWYADVGAGYAILENSDLEDGRLPGGRGELSADDGYAVTGALGYGFGNGLRAELELGYRSNDLDSIEVGGFGTTATGGVNGNISAVSGMANLFYDYPIMGKITPYIGGGLGVAGVTVDSTTLAVDESDTAFAYQFMGGLRYALTEQISARVGYRYFTTVDLDIQGTGAEYASHNVEVGLSFAF